MRRTNEKELAIQGVKKIPILTASKKATYLFPRVERPHFLKFSRPQSVQRVYDGVRITIISIYRESASWGISPLVLVPPVFLTILLV